MRRHRRARRWSCRCRSRIFAPVATPARDARRRHGHELRCGARAAEARGSYRGPTGPGSGAGGLRHRAAAGCRWRYGDAINGGSGRQPYHVVVVGGAHTVRPLDGRGRSQPAAADDVGRGHPHHGRGVRRLARGRGPCADCRPRWWQGLSGLARGGATRACGPDSRSVPTASGTDGRAVFVHGPAEVSRGGDGHTGRQPDPAVRAAVPARRWRMRLRKAIRGGAGRIANGIRARRFLSAAGIAAHG